MRVDSILVPDTTITLPRRNVLLVAFGAALTYVMVIPVLIAHCSGWLFEQIYFRILKIPMVPFSEHVTFDRWKLKHLNLFQRFNCAYCDYVNGLASWLKAVVNRTELYSCAIKHSSKRSGQEHQAMYAK
jgi:hypothetical protein